MRRLIAAIRDNDERKVEKAVLQLAGTRKILVLLAAVVLSTIVAFYLYAAFALAISQPGPCNLRAGVGQARQHVRAVTGPWLADVGSAEVFPGSWPGSGTLIPHHGCI